MGGDYKDSISERRQKRVERLSKNGMVVPREWLGSIQQVVDERGFKLEKLGSTLKSGFKISDPESDMVVRINLKTVKEYDLFLERVRQLEAEKGKIRKERR